MCYETEMLCICQGWNSGYRIVFVKVAVFFLKLLFADTFKNNQTKKNDQFNNK